MLGGYFITVNIPLMTGLIALNQKLHITPLMFLIIASKYCQFLSLFPEFPEAKLQESAETS